MTCWSEEALAEAASFERAPEEHVAGCPRCRARWDDQRAVRVALVASSPEPWTPSRRAEVAAELLARADAVRPRRRWAWPAAVAAVAAAAIALVTMRARTEARHGFAPSTSAAGAAVAPVQASRDAVYRLVVTASAAELTLDRGTVAAERREDQPPLRVVAAGAAIEVAAGKVEVTSVDGVIVRAVVLAGTAHVVTATATVALETGDEWRPPAEAPAAAVDPVAIEPVAIAPTAVDPAAIDPTPIDHATIDPGATRAAPTSPPHRRAPAIPTPPIAADPLPPPPDLAAVTIDPGVPPPPTSAGATAFRTGWQAHRAGRLAEALAAFDRVDDPAFAEDARFWAADAAERLGDRDDATRRWIGFVRAYPTSPRRAQAQAALARLSAVAPASGQ